MYCADCGEMVEVVVMIPTCDYMPNGLKTEIANHPKLENGLIQCSDFWEEMPNEAEPCNPSEMDWDEITPLEQYEDHYFRCSECDSLNVSKQK